MINMEVETSMAPAAVAGRVRDFFGKDLGLKLKEESPQCLQYEGGGGYVTATICEAGGKTRVTLVGQEWDYQIRSFSASLK